MWSFNSLSPRKLKEQGDQYVFKAQILLNDRGAESTPSRCQQAQERLVIANDYKDTLRGKCLLGRIRAARLYVDNAREALQDIQGWLDPPIGAVDSELDRPRYS